MADASHAPGLLVFGGTFDPPHYAHVLLPPLAAKHVGCDRVLYVPAAMNPLKTDRPTDAAHRLEMLRLAVADVPVAEICTLELDRPGPSYMVETLAELAEGPGRDGRMRLLMGVDSALSFPRWRDPDRILELATPAVMIRPPWSRETWEEALREQFDSVEAARWSDWTVAVPRMDISATEVRRRLECGADLSDLLPPAVLDYIRRHALYAIGAA